MGERALDLDPAPDQLRGLLVAATLAAGWVLHDVAVVVASANPALALRMVAGSLLLVVLAALTGWLLATSAVVFRGALVAVAVTVVATTLHRPPVDPASIGLAKSVLLLLVAAGVMVRLRPAWRCQGLAIGCALAAMAACLRRLRWGPAGIGYLVLEVLLAVFALALLVCLARQRRSVRWLTGATLALLCVLGIAASGWYSSRLRRPDQPAAAEPPPAARPNLLLITLDTVRADHLSVYGYHRPTTPGLEHLVREDFVLYSEARSTSSWTLPAHASLLTGLLPSEHGATHTRNLEQQDTVALRWSYASRLRDDVPTLAELLAERGYRTGAIVGNSTVLAHEMGLDRGFQHYDDRNGAWLQCRQSLLQQLGWQPALGCLPFRDATTITNLALSWLDATPPDRPFFLFLNYMDAHEPYVPPQPFDRALADKHLTDPLGPPPELKSLQYDRELLYLDSQLTRLLDLFRSAGRWQQTVIIITADHGEAFGEHRHWGHARYLYEELIHVPLLVKGVEQEQRRRPLVGQLIRGNDVFTLALAELGLAPPPRLPPHQQLIAEWYGSRHREQRGTGVSRDLLVWIEGRRKVIVAAGGEVEVYDLDGDHRELVNLLPSLAPEEHTRYRRQALEHWSRPRITSGLPELSNETLDRLRALGYL